MFQRFSGVEKLFGLEGLEGLKYHNFPPKIFLSHNDEKVRNPSVYHHFQVSKSFMHKSGIT